MKIIKQKVPGRLEVVQGRAIVWWMGAAAEVLAPSSTANSHPLIYLSFALVTLGPEEHILPSLVLDDWGNEIKSVKLYRWIREYGEQFPRAELFGYGLNGEQRQDFLRELELYAAYPCYAFATVESSIADAKLVADLLVVNPTESVPRPIDAPPAVEYPLRDAAVQWWSVPSETVGLEFLTATKSAMNDGKAR